VRFLPIILLSVGLLGVVMLMAGGWKQGFQAVRSISFALAVMIVLMALFAVIAESRS
jgi:hypothetical protein